MLLADDLGKDVGCYGGPVKTPAIDKLAMDGVRFTDFIPVVPSVLLRVRPLDGKASYKNGCLQLIHDESQNSHLLLSERTIAEILKDRGYSTAHIGKWHWVCRWTGRSPPPVIMVLITGLPHGIMYLPSRIRIILFETDRLSDHWKVLLSVGGRCYWLVG